ncbi:MAG: hypothetical protein IJN80_03685 [Clostridia bacterium]|nr:hypothetical protein [Clostridia bacterium]
MTEKEKGAAGFLYNPNYDQELIGEIMRCKDLCYEFNQLKPSEISERAALLGKMLGKMGKDAFIHSPFYCDYGYNISVGDGFFANHNCCILDGGKVSKHEQSEPA